MLGDNLYNEIVDLKNIEGAYFDLISIFDNQSKSSRYNSLDGVKLNDLDYWSEGAIKQVQKELKTHTPLQPLYNFWIPKKNFDKRQLYLYSIKDRIKAQAIARVLEPIIEKQLSPWLFSYRSSHPSYYAGRSVARRYIRYYPKDFVLVTDISDYFYSIDKDILILKLRQLGLSEKVMDLLLLFIKTKVYKNGEIFEIPVGVCAGTPLVVLFGNLYLNDLDHYLGSKVSLYRRVGDDIILFDPNLEKLQNLNLYINEEVKKLKLTIKPSKTKLIKTSQPFNFLGYRFFDKKIGSEASFIRKKGKEWKRDLSKYPGTILSRKLVHFKKCLFTKPNNFHNQFQQIVLEKSLASYDEDFKKLFKVFLRVLTVYFFGKYTPRNRRLLDSLLKGIPIESIHKYYLKTHYDKDKLSGLSF